LLYVVQALIPHSPATTRHLHLQRKRCQRFKMINRSVTFPLPFPFFSQLLSRADLPVQHARPRFVRLVRPISNRERLNRHCETIIAGLSQQPSLRGLSPHCRRVLARARTHCPSGAHFSTLRADATLPEDPDTPATIEATTSISSRRHGEQPAVRHKAWYNGPRVGGVGGEDRRRRRVG
jgi:hypothetical protein